MKRTMVTATGIIAGATAGAAIVAAINGAYIATLLLGIVSVITFAIHLDVEERNQMETEVDAFLEGYKRGLVRGKGAK